MNIFLKFIKTGGDYMAKEYVSTAEAQQMLGVCWKTVYNYLKKGQLTGFIILLVIAGKSARLLLRS